MRILTVATLCAIGLLAALWVVPGARPFDLGIIIRDPIVLSQVRQIVPAVLRAWRGGSPASAPSPEQRGVAPERFAARGPERVAAARTAAPRTPAPQSLALRAAFAAQVAGPHLRIDRVRRQAAAVTLDSADSTEASIAMDAPETATALTDESAQLAEEPEPKDTPASTAANSNPPANTSANSDSARELGDHHRGRPANTGQGSKGGKDAGKNREGKGGRDARRPDR